MEKTQVDNIDMPWTNEKTGIWINIFPIDVAFDHKYIAYMEYGQKEYQDIVDFDGYLEVPFAGEKFIIVRGYDHLMRSKYGDYMKMPPESKRISNHTLVSYYFV